MSAARPHDLILGIDLGTTNSLVAVCDATGTPRIVPDEHGRRLLPSVVRFGDGGRVVSVGHEAREEAVEHPAWTVASVKRLMGRSLRDAEVDLRYLSYEVVEGANDTARVRIPGGTVLSPQEISSIILRRLKEQASKHLGKDARRAVVTVPAYFDDAQRQATRDAGRLAGLEVVRIVNEPTAAALAYGLGLREKKDELIAVYDLGGGTFDISILRVTPREMNAPGSDPDAGSDAPRIAGADFFEVLSTKGDTHLGGDDVDQMIARLVREEASRAVDRSLDFDARTRQELRRLAEQTKIALSDRETAAIRLELTDTEGGKAVFDRSLTRGELERLMTPWIERTIELCSRALRDAGVSAKEISRVVMVGGSTRIPLVRRRVGELFGTEPYTALDPDEVVALGAAVQASIMSGANTGMLLLDVIPLSLGIETVGGAFAKIIVKNTTVPARATEMFSTSTDHQTSIKLHVLQGEREMSADCRSLGVFHLRGIPPMPAGIPQVEVEFLVDASGILHVSAHERRSGKRAALQIVPNHGLSAEEIDRIERESLAHAREDMTRHRIVDLIANSKLDVKWTESALGRVGDKLAPDHRAELEAVLDALRSFIARAEADWRNVIADEFHRAKEALDHASVRLHEIAIAESLRQT